MSAVRYAVSALALALLAVACSDDSPSIASSDGIAVRYGKVTSTDMSVSGATPDSATQDTTLDVVINGSGFVAGAAVTWALAGVQDSMQVRTNSTRYVSSRQLVANITISSSATIAKWDIVVTAAGKKGGIGTEAFAIKLKPQVETDSRTNLVFDATMNVAAPGATPLIAPTGIQGDSRDRWGNASTVSEYQGSFCGVDGKIFWTEGGNMGGDAIFDADRYYDPRRTSCGPARVMRLFLTYQPGGPPGLATTAQPFHNVRAVMLLGPGESISRKAFFNYTGIANCDRVSFDAAVLPGSANIHVTRLPDVGATRQWRVESEYPHMAMCEQPLGNRFIAKGLHYLPVAYTLTEVPYPYPSNP